MASSSGTSSKSSSGSEEVHILTDEKKRKRMISNRESARRCRMRKQKHLDELTAHMARFKNENNRIVTAMNAITQLYVKVEAENSVLRAQVAELSHRLQSLNEITETLNAWTGGFLGPREEPSSCFGEPIHGVAVNNYWNDAFANCQLPLMASADMFPY